MSLYSNKRNTSSRARCRHARSRQTTPGSDPAEPGATATGCIQIAAGFESVLLWWSTINKNVDWMNYIYYNQQRFVDFTMDAVKGLSEQLDAMTIG